MPRLRTSRSQHPADPDRSLLGRLPEDIDWFALKFCHLVQGITPYYAPARSRRASVWSCHLLFRRMILVRMRMIYFLIAKSAVKPTVSIDLAALRAGGAAREGTGCEHEPHILTHIEFMICSTNKYAL